MENKNTELYIAPQLEVLEVRVEQGYSGSEGNDGGGMNLPGWEII